MTAVILAQKLLYCADDFIGPYDNPLYNTWIKRISLEGLQSTESNKPALHSLFSSNLIDQISNEVLLGRYATNPPLQPKRHLASASEIRSFSPVIFIRRFPTPGS